jgi:hypothetical protein
LTNEELRVSIHRILFMFEFIQLIWLFCMIYREM